jgi:hypothetical protein
VNWLMHPHELDAKPDAVELVGMVDASKFGESGHYLVFRYRTNPPHWAAQDGWLGGIVGPYPDDAVLDPGGVHAFSSFAAIDASSPSGIEANARANIAEMRGGGLTETETAASPRQ